MKIISLLTIATVILNLFIVVPYGGFLATIEWAAIKASCCDPVSPLRFDLIVSVTLAGAQVLLIVALFLKKLKFPFVILGVLLMWVNYFYLLSNAREHIILLTALPFLLFSVILVAFSFRKILSS
jgi:hypothetical protein